MGKRIAIAIAALCLATAGCAGLGINARQCDSLMASANQSLAEYEQWKLSGGKTSEELAERLFIAKSAMRSARAFCGFAPLPEECQIQSGPAPVVGF